MGLLTNTKTDGEGKIVELVKKHAGTLSFLCYFVGVAWLVLLANKEYNLGTYFSEHALLPGLVVENFYDDRKVETVYERLSADETSFNPEDILEAFKSIGLTEIEIQNFNLTDPVTGDVSHGTNVFAVLRAKRSAGTESLILNIPYFRNNPKGRQNLPAFALMLVLAEYFSKQVYWAKDIVLLVPDGHLGTLAWVRGHQEISSVGEPLMADRVHIKVGNIQGALNLVLENNKVCSLSTKFHGINGQLPNLDLVNLVNKFVVQEWEKRPDWESDFWKMVSYMKVQATGAPTGSHGYFLKYGIESVTLYGSKTGKNCKHHSYSLGEIGRYVESMFRSLNNLLERLHQSFFFYLKTTPNRFVSIGLYFPPLALIIVPIMLKGASVWVTNPVMDFKTSLFYLLAFHSIPIAFRLAISHIGVASFGTITSLSPPILKSLALGLVAVLLLVTKLSASKVDSSVTSCLYCFSLLQLATVLYCLALFNPSLVVFISIIVSPLMTLFFFFSPNRRTWLLTTSTALLAALISYFYDNLDLIVTKYYYEAALHGNFAFDFVLISLLPALFVTMSVA